MAPSDQELETELANTVRGIYYSDKGEQLSVNLVRQQVEQKLDLENGFFKSDNWKDRSKKVIKEAVDKCDRLRPLSPELAAQPTPQTGAKVGEKRRPLNGHQDGAPEKRLKKEQPAKMSRADPIQPNDFNEPRPKRVQRLVARGKRRQRVAESEEDSPTESSAAAADDNDDDSSDVDEGEEEHRPKPKPKPKKKADQSVKLATKNAAPSASVTDSSLSELDEKSINESKHDPQKSVEGDDSSESEVLDEPPKRKRKSKDPAKGKPAVKPKAGTTRARISGADQSPEDAEIKKLQGQLGKCGVRKIWAFELKGYGDDSKAKISHLKKMLRDAGMDGRFSEGRAREIKERRELLADLEAVTEMNSYWGADNDGKASRSRRAATKTAAAPGPEKLTSDLESEEDDEDHDHDHSDVHEAENGSGNDDDDDDDDDGTDSGGDKKRPTQKPRGSAKYRAEMAFLGDDSESE